MDLFSNSFPNEIQHSGTYSSNSLMKSVLSLNSSKDEYYSDSSNEKSSTTEFSHLSAKKELPSTTSTLYIETEPTVYGNCKYDMSTPIQENEQFGERQFNEMQNYNEEPTLDSHFFDYSDPLILNPYEIDSQEQPNQNEEIDQSLPSLELGIPSYTNPLPRAPEIINNPESKAVPQIVKKKRSDVKDLVRHRSPITKRRLPHSKTTVKVQEKTEEKKKQFKNNFKNFLKKAIPFLISQLMECKLMECNPKDGDYDQMLLILESFLNKTSKDHILFLVKNVTLLEDSEFYHLSKVNRDRHKRTFLKEQKSNPDFRMLLFIKSHMQQPDSYEEYQHIVYVINKLNSFNRKYLLRFTMQDYIPIILRTKADKQDQFYTNNYIRYVLTNTSIIE